MNTRAGAFFLAAAMAGMLALTGCSKPAEVTPAVPVAPPAGDHVADLSVTEHVKTALQQNEALKGFDIGVVTLKGDVRLIGEVANSSQVEEAIGIARAAEGAHTIHNELTIKK